ncbi:hypothetical protein KDA08_00390 [Candidatus Saccharibacteria bacterium]|nr:hypothetical protein [Candidatus Saccharibacteria bacterium]
MIFRINGEPTEFEAYSLGYDNDLLDGVLLDMPQTYVYLSDHVEDAREMQALLPDDMQHFDLTGSDPDFEQVPHKWVLRSVERMIVKTAEQACREAVGED